MNIKKRKAGRRHQYDLSLKRKICEELLSGAVTVREAARK
jgi:hypothetical protein